MVLLSFGIPRWVLALAAAAVVATTGAAQEALSLFEAQPDGPLVSSEEIKALSRIAGLTADQAEVAETLREGLEADFKGAIRRRQSAYDDIQSDAQEHPQADQSRAYSDAANRFRERSAELERGLLNDLKSILTDEQADHWPDFERYRRRAHSRGWWQRPASDADLVKIVDGLGLDEAQRASVDPLLAEYERELDPAVIARMAVKRDGVEVDFGSDYQKRSEWYAQAYDRTLQLDQRLAGVNRKYARLLTPLLPAPKQEELQTRFVEASFINLYTPSEDRKKIDAAAKLADLTDEQKADLDRILTPFRKDVGVVEREAERLEDEYAYQYSWQQLSEGKAPKGYNERYNEIWALEGRALAAIKKALNDEQREKVDSAAGQ